MGIVSVVCYAIYTGISCLWAALVSFDWMQSEVIVLSLPLTKNLLLLLLEQIMSGLCPDRVDLPQHLLLV